MVSIIFLLKNLNFLKTLLYYNCNFNNKLKQIIMKTGFYEDCTGNINAVKNNVLYAISMDGAAMNNDMIPCKYGHINHVRKEYGSEFYSGFIFIDASDIEISGRKLNINDIKFNEALDPYPFWDNYNYMNIIDEENSINLMEERGYFI